MLKNGMMDRFHKALPVLKRLQEDLDWMEEEFSPGNATEEERSVVLALKQIAARPFDESAWRLERLFAPVELLGRLVKNADGRYQIEDTDRTFTSGGFCEALLPFHSDEDANYAWIPTAIESRNDEYYFTARPNAPMAGVLVRTKHW
jgi:hypothetical protein